MRHTKLHRRISDTALAKVLARLLLWSFAASLPVSAWTAAAVASPEARPRELLIAALFLTVPTFVMAALAFYRDGEMAARRSILIVSAILFAGVLIGSIA